MRRIVTAVLAAFSLLIVASSAGAQALEKYR